MQRPNPAALRPWLLAPFFRRPYISGMVMRSFGRGRPLKVPAESSVPTADDFRAVYSVAERFVPPEDIVRQPPRILRSCTGRFIRVWVIERQQANITLSAFYIDAASPGNALLVAWIAGRLTGNYGPKHSFSEAKERVSANAGPFVFWAAVSSPVAPLAWHAFPISPAPCPVAVVYPMQQSQPSPHRASNPASIGSRASLVGEFGDGNGPVVGRIMRHPRHRRESRVLDDHCDGASALGL
jgi:hypothetical protein